MTDDNVDKKNANQNFVLETNPVKKPLHFLILSSVHNFILTLQSFFYCAVTISHITNERCWQYHSIPQLTDSNYSYCVSMGINCQRNTVCSHCGKPVHLNAWKDFRRNRLGPVACFALSTKFVVWCHWDQWRNWWGAGVRTSPPPTPAGKMEKNGPPVSLYFDMWYSFDFH